MDPEKKRELYSALRAGTEELDEQTLAIYIEVPGSQVVLFQAYFETYEAIGLVRTLDIRQSLVSVLTTRSQFEDCFELLSSIRDEIHWHPARIPSEAMKEKYLGYGKGK